MRIFRKVLCIILVVASAVCSIFAMVWNFQHVSPETFTTLFQPKTGLYLALGGVGSAIVSNFLSTNSGSGWIRFVTGLSIFALIATVIIQFFVNTTQVPLLTMPS